MSFKLDKLLNNTISELRKSFSGSEEDFRLKLKHHLPEMIRILGETFKSNLLDQYKNGILKELREKEQNYSSNLFGDYKDAFEYLEIFIDLNRYCGKRALEEFEKTTNCKKDLKFHILIRIQARACQIATEIQTLLKNGYPDGAQARWRTIHELSVIFTVLNNNPLLLTEMFTEYDVIEKNKRAKDFEEKRSKIKWPEIDEENLNEISIEKDILIAKYGKEFGQSYGWTLNILPKGRRNFRELEELSGLDYMRPFYSWSNDNIHSGIGGLISRMGQMEHEETSYLKFIGPSFYGFADPAQLTTTSLLTITSQVLNFYENIENQILESFLIDLNRNIKDEFFNTNQKFKNEYSNQSKTN